MSAVHFSVELLANFASVDPGESGLHQKLESLFSSLARMNDISVPEDCSIKAMKDSGRSNVLYSLAKSLAIPRKDGSGPKFPTTRMPMGLLEYMVSIRKCTAN